MSIRYINPSVLLESTAGNEAAVMNLLQVFVRINPPMLVQLEDAFVSKNALKLNELAHAVKNSMLLLGAAQTAGKIEIMEVETRLNIYSFEEKEFEMLMDELASVSQEVDSYIAVLEAKFHRGMDQA